MRPFINYNKRKINYYSRRLLTRQLNSFKATSAAPLFKFLVNENFFGLAKLINSRQERSFDLSFNLLARRLRIASTQTLMRTVSALRYAQNICSGAPQSDFSSRPNSQYPYHLNYKILDLRSITLKWKYILSRSNQFMVNFAYFGLNFIHLLLILACLTIFCLWFWNLYYLIILMYWGNIPWILSVLSTISVHVSTLSFFTDVYLPNSYLLPWIFALAETLISNFYYYAQIIFQIWELHMETWEFFYQLDFFELYWVFCVLFFFYVAAFLTLARILLLMLFRRYDPWTLFLRLFYSVDFLRSTPEISELSQTFESGLLNATSSSSHYYDPTCGSSTQALFLYEYNLHLGFGGYVGFINYFPAYDTVLSANSFFKSRPRVEDTSLYFFWRFLYSLKILKTPRSLDGAWLWRDTDYRFNYFNSSQKMLNNTSFVKTNLPTIPRVKLPFYKNLFIQFFALFVNPVSNFGDLEVIRLRERYFYYITSGRELFVDDEYAENLAPISSTILGSSVDWYHRELSAAVLARTVQRKSNLRSRKLFNLGWQALVNDYSFWRADQDLEANSSVAFEDPVLDHYDHEDDTASAFESLTAPLGYDPFIALPWEDAPTSFSEDDPEAMFRPDSMRFEDGFLHDDFESLTFEEETFDLIDEGMAGDDIYDDDDDDLFDFFSNPLLSYGAGQEEDYLRASFTPQNTIYALDHGDADFAESHEIFSSFYDDISDHYWLTTSNLAYKNFLEYPSARFLNHSAPISSLPLKRQTFSDRFYAGRMFSFFSPFFFQMLVPNFSRFRLDICVSLAAGLLTLYYGSVLLLSDTYFELTVASLLGMSGLFAIPIVMLFLITTIGYLILMPLLNGSVYTTMTLFTKFRVGGLIFFAFLFCLFQPLPYINSIFDVRSQFDKKLPAFVSTPSVFFFNHARRYDSSLYQKKVKAIFCLSQIFKTWTPESLFHFSFVSSRAVNSGYSKFLTPTTNLLYPAANFREHSFLILSRINRLFALNGFNGLLNLPVTLRVEYLARMNRLFSLDLSALDNKIWNTFRTLNTNCGTSRLPEPLFATYNFTSKSSLVFEDFRRLSAKQSLIQHLPLKQPNFDSDHVLKKSFFDSAFFYSVLERKLFALDGSLASNSIERTRKDLSSPLVSSFLYNNKSRVASFRDVTIPLQEFSFFSSQIFGERQLLGSQYYYDFARLLFSERYLSTVYFKRFFSSNKTALLESDAWFLASPSDAIFKKNNSS